MLRPGPARPRLARGTFVLVTALALLAPAAARAYVDVNANKIDDRIEAVHLNGWNAAFVGNDPARRMRIGVENPANPVFAVYVRYDRMPNSLDDDAKARRLLSLLARRGFTEDHALDAVRALLPGAFEHD